MPRVELDVNVDLTNEAKGEIANGVIKMLGDVLNKPAAVVQVVVSTTFVSFAGDSKTPSASWTLSSIGFQDKETELIQALTALSDKHCGVAANRCFVRLNDHVAGRWGFSGMTVEAFRASQQK